jgi:hypothetical protein
MKIINQITNKSKLMREQLTWCYKLKNSEVHNYKD